MVTDQYGQAIRGAAYNTPEGRLEEVWFAPHPPRDDEPESGARILKEGDGRTRKIKLGTHAQVVAALAAERIDWWRLNWAGWPQLPYDVLKGLKVLPRTPAGDLRKIADPALRADALRRRREEDAAEAAEIAALAEE